MSIPGLRFRSLLVQDQQSLQDLFVAEIERPAIRVEHGPVEFLVGQVEPGRALVVYVGQGTLFQLGGAHPRRVEPGIALLDQFTRSFRDGFRERVILGFFSRGPGKGEGFEGSRWSVSRSVFQ